MSAVLSGPMFEPSQTEMWKSVHGKHGAHYNVFGAVDDSTSMRGLRRLFPDGKANECNVCIFSTSGIHGSYATIEDVEAEFERCMEDGGDEEVQSITFLVIQPRIVCTRFGNVTPESAEDFEFLKKLRQSSWGELAKIGKQY